MRLGMAYYGSYLPEHLEQDLTTIKNLGCEEVIITLSENDFHIMQGKLKFVPRIAHNLGLKLLANFWGYVCSFGGGRVSKLLTEKPQVWQVDREGKSVGMGCPNHPLVIETAQRMVDECIKYNYDGFFWDEPTRFDCYCKACQDKYYSLYGESLPRKVTPQLREFRNRTVIDYVQLMSDYVKKSRSSAETATCVMISDRETWEDVAKIPSLDSFGTDPYWLASDQPVSYVVRYSQEVVRLCRKNGKSSQVWLQCWSIPRGKEPEIYEAGKLIAAEKPDIIYTWAYRAGLGTNEESENPEEAWKYLVKTYQELAKL